MEKHQQEMKHSKGGEPLARNPKAMYIGSFINRKSPRHQTLNQNPPKKKPETLVSSMNEGDDPIWDKVAGSTGGR